MTTNLERLLEIGMGYWNSKAFLAACELRLFTMVSRGENTTARIADMVGVPYRNARILMDGMVSLGLLIKDVDGYSTTDLSRDLLVDGKPFYMGDFFIAVNRMFYNSSVDFDRALREGHPVWNVDDEEFGHRPISSIETQLFAKAMYSLNKPVSEAFGRIHDLSERRYLLDIGGGSGGMSISAVQNAPLLTATILDRPLVCSMAEKHIYDSGLCDKITTAAIDFFAEDYPDGADVHLYSNIFQNFNPDLCWALLTKSFRALPMGGEIIIIDYVLDENRAAPPFATIFNFLAVVTMDGGETRTFQEYKEWLETVGFSHVQRAYLLGPSSLIWAVKSN